MKFILGVAFIALAMFGNGQTSKKVLFIGNSYTSANNLPGLVSSLAAADGNNLTTDAHIPGGAQLNGHASNATVLNKIAAEEWDFVVLQEQSQKPSFPDAQVQSGVYPYAVILSDSIHSNNECSVPLFYNTWGRQNGDPQWEGINTFEKMNSRLFNAYTHMVNAADGMMSPVGVGFAHIKQDVSAVVDFASLYTGDGSHPTIHGSYLAACIFNNIIFDQTSTGNSFLPTGVTQSQAAYLQGVADHVVYDVDSVQVDFRPLTNNSFTYIENEAEVTFTPSIVEGNFVSWDFGDGQVSTQENPTHNYINTGVYTVKLFSSNSCSTHSTQKEVIISSLSVSDEHLFKLKIYPNPSPNGVIHIELPINQSYTVYTVLGEEVYTGKEQQLILDKGVYVIRAKDTSQKVIVR
nr:DUF4886 domain-containing protein [uncultured Brumimicrobium sp.]